MRIIATVAILLAAVALLGCIGQNHLENNPEKITLKGGDDWCKEVPK